MFIPRGHMAVAIAVEIRAKDRRPDLMQKTKPKDLAAFERLMSVERAIAAGVSISPGKRYRLGTPEADESPMGQRLLQLRQMKHEWEIVHIQQNAVRSAAREQMLQALGDGDLEAIIIDQSGMIQAIPHHVWRMNSAPTKLQQGFISFSLPQSGVAVSGHILIAETVFTAWRQTLPTGAVGLSLNASDRPTLQPKVTPLAEYTERALGAWFILRSQTWPADVPPPSEQDCIMAARKQFRDLPGRDKIREIRRRKVDPSWLKTGPKRPPKSRDI